MSTIGEMRQVIKFQKNTPVDDDAGGQADNYGDLLTTRGKLRKSRGYRSLEAGETLLNSSYVLECRIQAALVTQIDQSLRVVCDNQVFTIVSCEQIDQKNFMYRFILNEAK